MTRTKTVACRLPFLSFGDASATAAERFARAAVLSFAFVLPFTHNAALKNVGLVAMIAALVLTALSGRLKLDWRSPVIMALTGVTAVALVSSVFGTDVGSDLNAFRKHFLPMLVSFPLVVIHFRRREAALALLAVLATGFALRGGLALYEMLTIGREGSLFFKGYGIDAALYIPLLMGLVVLAKGVWRQLSVAALTLTIMAMLVGGGRTATAGVMLACVLIPSMLGHWRHTLMFVVGTGLIAGAVFMAKPELVQHYGHALTASSYIGPSGMSARYPIWIGVWDVARERPVLGHGFGWKKLGRTAVEQGFVERWRASGDPYREMSAWWFSLPTVKVNPHSLTMQLLFETGFVGLAVYAAMLAILIRQALSLARGAPPEWRPFAATVVGFLASYVVINISNGLWLGAGSSTMLMAILEVCRQAKWVLSGNGGR